MASKLVVYHAISESLYCDDGFGAALCAFLRFGYSAEYLKGIHGKVLPVDYFRDKDVFFLDFCYDSYELMEEISKVSRTLTVIDHHETTNRIFENAPFGSWVRPSNGSNEATCILAYRYFCTTPGSPEKIPSLLYHVRDNELWLHENPYTKAYIYRLRTLPHRFDQWEDLLNKHGSTTEKSPYYEEFVKQGFVNQEQIESLASTIADASFPVTVDGVSGEAVNAPRVFASLVGDLLAKKSQTFGAVFYIDRDTADVELRSIKGGFDVEKLATQYGGGGHKSAAHFSLPVHRLISLFDVKSNSDISLNSLLLVIYHGVGKAWDSVSEGLLRCDSVATLNTLSELEQKINEEYSEYGAKAAATYSEAPLSSAYRSIFSRFMYRLAILFDLPYEEDKPKLYHRIFPYAVGTEPVFEDEEKIRGILNRSRGSRARDEEEMLADNILATVKFSYRAILRKPVRTYTINVSSVYGEVGRVFKFLE